MPGLHSTREQAEGLRSLGCPKPNLQVELSDFLQEIRVLKAQGTANRLGKSLTPRPLWTLLIHLSPSCPLIEITQHEGIEELSRFHAMLASENLPLVFCLLKHKLQLLRSGVRRSCVSTP